MSDAEKRRQRLQEVQRKGLYIPAGILSEIEKDMPGPQIREWGWWAHVWIRPTASVVGDKVPTFLSAVQDDWDRSQRFVSGRLAYESEREAQKAAERAEVEAQAATARATREAELTEQLRRRYLEQPGTSEESFERALPELLEQRARAAVLADDVRIESPIGKHEILT